MEEGRVTDVKFEQLLKAELPIEVTDVGISIAVKSLQPEKADSSMEVTEDGMDIVLIPSQFRKADAPMVFIVFGIELFLHPKIKVFELFLMIALQLLRLS